MSVDALRARFSSGHILRDPVKADALVSAVQEPTKAAVLVPIVLRAAEPTILLTRRTAHLSDHAGQISFPGGRVEPEDIGPIATALRETVEEVGLGIQHIEILGMLPEYQTGTGYRVTPVVGLVNPPFDLAPDTFEVAEIFEIPLGFFMNPENHQIHERVIGGRTRRYYAMPYLNYYVWGATAAMLVNLYRFLSETA